jgi:hypothetical protein
MTPMTKYRIVAQPSSLYIECMILELMHDAYHDGWQDGVAEMADSEMPL